MTTKRAAVLGNALGNFILCLIGSAIWIFALPLYARHDWPVRLLLFLCGVGTVVSYNEFDKKRKGGAS